MSIFTRVSRVVLILAMSMFIVYGIINVCRPERFEAPEYKDVPTEVLGEVGFRENPSKTSQKDQERHLYQGQTVVMTGMLYGPRGEVYNLYAEVIDHGRKGWVPLVALDACKNIPD